MQAHRVVAVEYSAVADVFELRFHTFAFAQTIVVVFEAFVVLGQEFGIQYLQFQIEYSIERNLQSKAYLFELFHRLVLTLYAG